MSAPVYGYGETAAVGAGGCAVLVGTGRAAGVVTGAGAFVGALPGATGILVAAPALGVGWRVAPGAGDADVGELRGVEPAAGVGVTRRVALGGGVELSAGPYQLSSLVR